MKLLSVTSYRLLLPKGNVGVRWEVPQHSVSFMQALLYIAASGGASRVGRASMLFPTALFVPPCSFLRIGSVAASFAGKQACFFSCPDFVSLACLPPLSLHTLSLQSHHLLSSEGGSTVCHSDSH